MDEKEIKNKIESTKERILELKSEIDARKTELEEVKNDEFFDSMDFQMNNDKANSVIEKYKFLKPALKMGSLKNALSQLERDLEFKKFQLFDEERRLKGFEDELKFHNRAEINLIDSKDGIFIESDGLKINLIKDLQDIINQYKKEYNAMIDSEDVKKYSELKMKIIQAPEYENLPKATQTNKDSLREYKIKRNLICETIGDRLVVDSDFISTDIKDEESMIKYYNRKIEEEKSKLNEFQPSGAGRVFSKLRQKQESDFCREVEWEIQAAERRIAYGEDKIRGLRDLYEKFVAPSMKFFEIVKQIDEIKSSKDVRRFIAEGEVYKENIQNHTILKNCLSYENFIAQIISSNKKILDKIDVKLTKEQILKTIFGSEFHTDLAVELMNAGYKLSS